MASEVQRPQHLDVAEGEVVYCHACAHEWFRRGSGITCPVCLGDVTELIDPQSDPRQSIEDDDDDIPVQDTARTAYGQEYEPENGEVHHSDPPEADIDEHADGFGYDSETEIGEGGNHPDADPRRSVERFLGAVSTIDLPLITGISNENLLEQLNEVLRSTTSDHVGWAAESSAGSVTFYASNGPIAARQEGEGLQTFASMFNSAFGAFGSQLTSESLEAAAEQGAAAQGPSLMSNIGNLLSIIGSGVQGDAVYTQEAMDRVITSLMDANPQSNAAPPATNSGLANLPRRTIDDDLRSEDGNTECSICIDGMKVGEVIVSLPCKHSFHEECVVLWLREHNTCPVCRTPMEQNTHSRGLAALWQQRQRHNEGQNANANANAHESQGQRQQGESDVSMATDNLGDADEPTQSQPPPINPQPVRELPHTHLASGTSRPPNQGQTRLNEAMRHISSQQHERERSRGTSTGFSYDTSRLQRRTSMSPTSPRVAVGEAEGSMRERSPSQSSRRTGSSIEDQSSGSGNGTTEWLRGRFVGGR